ncbi:(deoxy)nucleoside triphosphate pyrophosphohydrolase [Olsenella sp. An293]|uniref:(deoxy)nucleoside triphosphate pyrophosphohydrolase n=1 Tax=Olsenella sp. An293 TaxID=1965626 RepID=UPI000B3A28E7|nr:(deoxy)nucleoside triphosphate pyrophosphohydrolase [Olsenella sp. An293]OUO32055.1 DNA mismatch repair protein MutT [Olsenella sp. An293]
MKTIHVAAAIICRDNQVLAAQRGYGEFKDGWEFPGGKLEPGETGEQACAREIEEELCVTIGNLSHLCTIEHDYDTFHLSMECFLCEIVDGAINDTEHENLLWLSTNHLWDVDWLPADVKVVRALEERLAG